MLHGHITNMTPQLVAISKKYRDARVQHAQLACALDNITSR